MKATFAQMGLITTYYTHACRKMGAYFADMAGADPHSIARLGLWAMEAMSQSYLGDFPLEAMRGVAGWSVRGGSFYLPRGSLEPPQSLAKQIFPEIESWLQKMQENQIQQDIAAKGFLDLLIVLRKILLQDSVLWLTKVGVSLSASACQ